MKAKSAHLFRVHFDNFGTDTANEHLMLQVQRATRPGTVFFDLLGLPEAETPTLEIDLRDDITDRTRAEVVTQVRNQIRESAEFSLVIETLDEHERVVEQWRLSHCRIVECRFDELTLASGTMMIHLAVMCGAVSTTVFGEMLELFG
jgi:hypothetical protein